MERTPTVAAVDSDDVPTTPNPPSPTSTTTSTTTPAAPQPAPATTAEPADPPDEPAGPAEPQPSSSVAGPTSPDTSPAARFTLHRSRTDRMISGVCGGLAESLGVDAALVRIGLVVLTLLAFPLGPVVYVAIWILAPEQ